MTGSVNTERAVVRRPPYESLHPRHTPFTALRAYGREEHQSIQGGSHMRASYRQARVATLMIVTSLIVGSPAPAQEQKTTRPIVGEAHHVMSLTPAELTWTAGPPMLPPGASMALIEGSFSKPGPFTARLRFPRNYRIPPHWHPVKVTVTVMSGTFNMGFGDELDTEKGKMLPAGSIF